MLEVAFTPVAPYQLARSAVPPDATRRRSGGVLELAYPAGLISQARQTCDWLVSAVSSRAEPFGEAGAAWLAQARQGA